VDVMVRSGVAEERAARCCDDEEWIHLA
jgi:hypothetical protein